MQLPPPSPRTAAWIGGLALILFLGALVAYAISERQRETGRATKNLEQQNRIFAEHVARSLDSVEVLLDEMGAAIAPDDWRAWSRDDGRQRLQARLTRSLPQIRQLVIFDADGNERYTSFSAEPPPVNVKDRPYFRSIAGGAAHARYGPFIGRNSAHWTYALARRLDDGHGKFSGVLLVAIDPDRFAEFCRGERIQDDIVSALVSEQGRVIALCRAPGDGDDKGTGEDFRQVLAHGDVAEPSPLAMRTGTFDDGHGALMATLQVTGYPDLYIVSSVPKRRLLQGWFNAVGPVGLLALAALAALGVAILMIHGQLHRLAALTAALRESRDTLERRVGEATREVEARRNEALRLAETKSRFFAAASHDLRQPLHALSLFIGDLARVAETPEQKTLVDRIETATRAMTGQLRNLLDLSRLDMANIVPQRSAQALQALFSQLAATYSATAEATGVRLLTRARTLAVDTDPALLLRLLGNLVENAIKFSPQGTVLVCARWRHNAVRIEVRDNGAGIADIHKQAIYDEFYQVGNSARDPDAGLGLGLAIAQRIAHLLGTRVSLDSQPDRGSVFALTLPCASDRCAGNAELPAGTPPRLVLIGPDEACADFGDRARRWGYAVDIASTVTDAWRLVAAGKSIPVLIHPYGCLLSGDHHSLLHEHPGIVITAPDCDLPELGAYQLREPIRPARLRALLRSLH